MSSNAPQRTGRKRSQEKSAEECKLEHKAKGHDDKPRKPGDTHERREERGHQRGFGRNQGKETSESSTEHGTKGAQLH